MNRGRNPDKSGKILHSEHIAVNDSKIRTSAYNSLFLKHYSILSKKPEALHPFTVSPNTISPKLCSPKHLFEEGSMTSGYSFMDR